MAPPKLCARSNSADTWGSEDPSLRLRNDDTPTVDRVKSFVEDSHTVWGGNLANEGLRLISASAGKTVFEYKVNETHVNSLGNLHGGCCATIFDWTTTTALVPISRPGFWVSLGVSRTLSVTYLRPIPKDEIVIIENEVVHAGKRLCAIKGIMKRKSDSAVMATCEHGKVNIDPDIRSNI